jgi:hypothetical protein
MDEKNNPNLWVSHRKRDNRMETEVKNDIMVYGQLQRVVSTMRGFLRSRWLEAYSLVYDCQKHFRRPIVSFLLKF